MISNLKCPFCETELEQGIELLRGGHILGCPKCKRNADDIFWFAMIKAKQDLEIAKSYIKGISQMVINSGDNIYVVIRHFKKLAEQTLKQIEQKDKK